MLSRDSAQNVVKVQNHQFEPLNSSGLFKAEFTSKKQKCDVLTSAELAVKYRGERY